jgi:hypothetical protein
MIAPGLQPAVAPTGLPSNSAASVPTPMRGMAPMPTSATPGAPGAAPGGTTGYMPPEYGARMAPMGAPMGGPPAIPPGLQMAQQRYSSPGIAQAAQVTPFTGGAGNMSMGNPNQRQMALANALRGR